MALRPWAFLPLSPLNSINNTKAFFFPLCSVSLLVFGNIWRNKILSFSYTCFLGYARFAICFGNREALFGLFLGICSLHVFLSGPSVPFSTFCKHSGVS